MLSVDGRTGQSGAPPDTVRCATGHCPVRKRRHPTVRVLTVSTVGALTSWCTGHCLVRQPRHPTVMVLTVSTVGALTSWCTRQSGAAPDRHDSLSGAPSTCCSDAAQTVHAL
jgi:hypothetical protein